MQNNIFVILKSGLFRTEYVKQYT